MNRRFFVRVISNALLGLLSGSLFAQQIQDSVTQRWTFDDAINDYAAGLISRIPQSKGIAVIAFETDKHELMVYFFGAMEEKLWEKKNITMEILERRRIENLQQELNFSLSGQVSDETAVGIGKAIGADTLIYGSMSKIGKEYRMTLRATGVETSHFSFPRSYELIVDSRLAGLLGIKSPRIWTDKETRLWTIGVSVGTSFAAP
ncbi:MAG: CsgG/HfaB family protein [Treponema sp.]|nr:CsgG/HfaB family protein [Treponema sp.]